VATQYSPRQQLLLWNLLITGDTPKQSQLPNHVPPSERDALVAAGLVSKEPGENRSQVLVLTDKAWDWASSHCEVDFGQAKNTRVALETLISVMGRHVSAGATLAELLRPAGDAPALVEPVGPSGPADSPETAVRQAYMAASGGRYEREVRLADLRMRLPALSRQDVDEALLSLQREERAALMSIDDPLRRGPADEQAALTVGGDPRHLIFLRG
jgi:hypothetical protein